MAKLNKTYNFLIRTGILLITLYYLYEQLFKKHNLHDFLGNIQGVVNFKGFWFFLLLTLLLIPVNLLLESYKWQLLMAKMEKINLWQAFKAVLTGISVSMFLPNRMGDYLGRVFVLKKADRLQATLSTVLGSVAQLLTTLLFGAGSLIILLPRWLNTSNSLNQWAYAGLIFGIVLLALLMVFSFLNFSVFTYVLQKLSGRAYNKIAHYAVVFSWYDMKELLQVLLISILRYLVFSFQFYLLLHLLKVPVNYFHAMVLIGLIYLLMTIIPTVALSEIGVRGSVSLYVFGLFFGSSVLSESLSQQIVTASSALWLFNLALPALLGVFFIYRLNFFRNMQNHVH